MRLLLDECMPRRFGCALAEHHVATVQSMRWRGLRNGALLNRARAEFDVFITVDRGIPFQQNLRNETLAIIVLRALSKRRRGADGVAASGAHGPLADQGWQSDRHPIMSRPLRGESGGARSNVATGECPRVADNSIRVADDST